ESFLAKNRNIAVAIDHEISLGRVDQVRQLAHGVKGSAANLGADAIALTASDLEQAAREAGKNGLNPDLTAVRAAFDLFKSSVTPLLRELATYFVHNPKNTHGTGSSRPLVDPAQARKLLGLAAVLLDQDLSAAINCLNIIGADMEQSSLAKPYRRLRKEVASFDTALARKSIDEILGTLPTTPP
ncbi:MAG: Hpt domain-containing protein, partial [Alphaproteobacteria bacterium]|nr:Hpt domain-containing protein [Alphaproteobacteria bacterium]